VFIASLDLVFVFLHSFTTKKNSISAVSLPVNIVRKIQEIGKFFLIKRTQW